MKFLGNVVPARIPDIEEAIARSASACHALKAAVNGTGYFGKTRLPMVLWLEIAAGAKGFRGIATRLGEHLTPLGFASESGQLSPHITVARIREPHTSDELAERHVESKVGPIEFDVEAVAVFQSSRAPEGLLLHRVTVSAS